MVSSRVVRKLVVDKKKALLQLVWPSSSHLIASLSLLQESRELPKSCKPKSRIPQPAAKATWLVHSFSFTTTAGLVKKGGVVHSSGNSSSIHRGSSSLHPQHQNSHSTSDNVYPSANQLPNNQGQDRHLGHHHANPASQRKWVPPSALRRSEDLPRHHNNRASPSSSSSSSKRSYNDSNGIHANHGHHLNSSNHRQVDNDYALAEHNNAIFRKVSQIYQTQYKPVYLV